MLTIPETEKIILNSQANNWDSLVINKRKPYTYRMWVWVGYERICLHRFDSCNEDEALAHPHAWPCTVRMLSGMYHMHVGFNLEGVQEPDDVVYNMKLSLSAGSTYEMAWEEAFHKVIPVTTCYSFMINGPNYENPHSQVRTTRGKKLDPMTREEKETQLETIKALIRNNNAS